MKSIRILSALALIFALLLAFTSCGALDSASGLLSGEITFDEFLDSLGTPEQEDPGDLHEHTYSDAWSKDDDGHWHAATCEHTAEISGYEAHSYVDGACKCGQAEPVAPHEHTYSDTWSRDADGHWHAATCGHVFEKGGYEAHSYVDGVCKCGRPDPDATHEHTYSDAWSKDADGHWHAATCEHTAEISGYEAHSYVDGACKCGQTDPNPPSGGNTPPVDDTEYPEDGEYRYAIDSYVPLTDIPAFEGKNWTVLNGNKPYFVNADKSTIAYTYYSELDSLGRAGMAVGCLGPETLPTGNRKDPTYNPTGWIQATYSGDIVSGGQIWNRSHLIAWSLADDSGKMNLVTGTPYFNQVGMVVYENMVRDYIKETGNHVLYRITPVFVGNELVCRGVTMEAFSLEDNGGTDDAITSDGLYFNVFIHNVNPGIIINYATGATSLDPNYDDGKDDVVEPDDVTYVVNCSKNPYKIHEADCSSVTAMAEKNKVYYTCTYDEVVADIIASGKTPSPCGSCHPEDKQHDPK